jgi:hypothetical protein
MSPVYAGIAGPACDDLYGESKAGRVRAVRLCFSGLVDELAGLLASDLHAVLLLVGIDADGNAFG